MLKFIYKPILVILITIIFFLSYNKFLLDRSLEDLKSSLDIISKAESKEEAEDVKMVLELLLLDKVTSKEFDAAELASLEYAHSVVAKGAEVSSRELKDAAISVKQIVEKRIEEREIKKGRIIVTLDTVSTGIAKSAERLQALQVPFVAKKEMSKEIDTALLSEAISYEKGWKLIQAKEAYEKLIANYPDYEEIKSIKLKLAYIYQKIGLYNRAEELFSEIVKEYRGTLEAKAATKLLSALDEVKKSSEERNAILKKMPSIFSKEELQNAYYKLGIISIRLLDFVVARNAFEKAIEANPSSELAVRAKFNIAWSYKFQARLEEGISAFEELIKEHPEEKITLDAKYQVADIYHRQGRYEEAIVKYKEIATEYENSNIAPLVMLQGSMTYLYDLNNPEKAQGEFLELKKKYSYTEAARPESEYSKEIMPEEMLRGGQLEAILAKGATLFAEEVLGISRGKSIGERRPYEKVYSETDINRIVAEMLAKEGLSNNVSDTYINLTEENIEGSGLIKLGKISVKGSGAVKVEAARGDFKFTVDRYKFTFGNSNIPVPIPKFLVDGVIERLNTKLTKRNLLLLVEEIALTENNVSIKGFRH